MEADTSTLRLPPPTHIGVVVRDIDEVAEYYTAMWGIGPWRKYEVSPSKEQMLVGEPFRLKVALAQWGPLGLELLQPEDRKSVWSEFLKTHGGGLHHVCFDVSNWDAVVAQLRKQSAKMVAGATRKDVRWCYFETKPGRLLIEIKQQLGQS